MSGTLIRLKAAAAQLGISEWLLRKLAHEREICFVQLTPRSPMLFDRADLDAWVAKRKQ